MCHKRQFPQELIIVNFYGYRTKGLQENQWRMSNDSQFVSPYLSQKMMNVVLYVGIQYNFALYIVIFHSKLYLFLSYFGVDRLNFKSLFLTWFSWWPEHHVLTKNDTGRDFVWIPQETKLALHFRCNPSIDIIWYKRIHF